MSTSQRRSLVQGQRLTADEQARVVHTGGPFRILSGPKLTVVELGHADVVVRRADRVNFGSAFRTIEHQDRSSPLRLVTPRLTCRPPSCTSTR